MPPDSVSSLVQRYLTRHEPRVSLGFHFKSTVGAVLGVSMVGALSAWSGLPLLMAPLGPTALLIFGQPENPSSQPVNIFAGYFIGAVFATLAELTFPGMWWVTAIAVGLAMLVMLVLRVTHPPAAAVPLVIASSQMQPAVLFEVMLLACIVLTCIGVGWHRLPPAVDYPIGIAKGARSARTSGPVSGARHRGGWWRRAGRWRGSEARPS